MNYTVTKYPQGTFCWADVSSHDINATVKFMMTLMGWTSETMPTDQSGMDYTMFRTNGMDVAGASPMPSEMTNVPSLWRNYICVEDVDAMTKKAQELGGKIRMPAADAMDVGRFSVIEDPAGAGFCLWQPKKHIGAKLVNTVGAMSWNELYTRETTTCISFYSDLFGWTFEQMPGGANYWVIKNSNGRMNGGMMAIEPQMGQMPPKWMVYFTVANIDESVKLVKANGGTVYMTKDIDQGRIAVIADPAGASFLIIELSAPPEEWVE